MTNNKWQALKGYLESLYVGFTITPAYFERLNKHYIPNCEATISQEPDELPIANFCDDKNCTYCAQEPIVKANPEDCKDLIDRIDEVLYKVLDEVCIEDTDIGQVLKDCKAKLIQLSGGE